MTKDTIDLFMWGYQGHYRIGIQILIRDVFKELGLEVDAEVLVVGARAPDALKRNKVCIEPENQKWDLALFDGLLDLIESAYKDHSNQSMFYGDEASMRDKPEWMRRDSVRSSIARSLQTFDVTNTTTSFCGSPRRIDDYYVVTVIQIPNSSFAHFSALPDAPTTNSRQANGFRSLAHSAIQAVLKEATECLEKPDPGRSLRSNMRTAEEIIKIAAKDFLHTPGLAIENSYISTNLFDSINLISSLMYEGTKGIGRLVIANPSNKDIEYLAKFVRPVPFRDSRWVRKTLQMTRAGVGIIADSQNIHGLGKVKDSHDFAKQDIFAINFLDHYYWELACGKQVLLQSHYGIPKLPQEAFNKNAFLANFTRIFSKASDSDALRLWGLLNTQLNLSHGSMIVVAEDAEQESKRLEKQGTSITPTLLSEVLLKSASGIDGSILIDPFGICHTIGVILDGEANSECIPSRGSRYNSAVRYVGNEKIRRLAIVVSDDKTVNLIPPLRKLVSQKLLNAHVDAFEIATLDNYHVHRNWLDKHRFYINREQCDRLNTAIKRVEKLQENDKSMNIRISTNPFHPNLQMDKSYYLEEFERGTD